MPILSEAERQNCHREGEPWGNAHILVSPNELLLYRPIPTGGTRRLMMVMIYTFSTLGLSVLPLAVFSFLPAGDLWILLTTPPLLLGLSFVMHRSLGCWAELRMDPSGYQIVEVRGLSKEERVARGPLTEIRGIKRKVSGKGFYSAILEVPNQPVLTVARGPEISRCEKWISQWLEKQTQTSRSIAKGPPTT